MVSRLNGRLVLCLAVELGDQLHCVAPFISVSPCLYLPIPILRCDVSWKAPTGMCGLVGWCIPWYHGTMVRWWGLVYPVVSGEWCYSLPGHRIIPGRWAYWEEKQTTEISSSTICFDINAPTGGISRYFLPKLFEEKHRAAGSFCRWTNQKDTLGGWKYWKVRKTCYCSFFAK